jgi:hypothetical protein
MLWIPATLLAAAAQTARNAMQSNLTASLGTLGATQVRFIYGWPFAVAFLVLAAGAAGHGVPGPTSAFIADTAGGAVAQIAGDAPRAHGPGTDRRRRRAAACNGCRCELSRVRVARCSIAFDTSLGLAFRRPRCS